MGTGLLCHDAKPRPHVSFDVEVFDGLLAGGV